MLSANQPASSDTTCAVPKSVTQLKKEAAAEVEEITMDVIPPRADLAIESTEPMVIESATLSQPKKDSIVAPNRMDTEAKPEDADMDADDEDQEHPPKTPVFKVIRRKEEDSDIVEIEIKDSYIISSIQNHIKSEELYADPPVIGSEELFTVLPQLRKIVANEDPVPDDEEVYCGGNFGSLGKKGLKKLVQFLEDEHNLAIVKIKNMTDQVWTP
ncbi:hypothetical protein BDR26DRAFT_610758 [Obelidium mucronatum]|nr:hypothetical protein BDR26DRAFT_610758 [Obelidium mucronatum]